MFDEVIHKCLEIAASLLLNDPPSLWIKACKLQINIQVTWIPYTCRRDTSGGPVYSFAHNQYLSLFIAPLVQSHGITHVSFIVYMLKTKREILPFNRDKSPSIETVYLSGKQLSA